MAKIKNFVKVYKTIKNWPFYFIDYWCKRNGEFEYLMQNGTKYRIRSNTDDRYILNEICVHKIYNPPGFEIGPEDTVIDVGTHIGIFSIYAATCAKNGKVYSFEPNKTNFEMLQKNILLNKCQNIYLTNKGISDKKGITKFYVSSNNKYTGRHSLYKELQGDNIENIETITLKDIIKENKIKKIDFMKLDCEGAEYDILFGSSKEMLNKISKISMEYHDIDEKRNGNEIISFLQKNNFKVIKKENEAIIYAKNLNFINF